MRICDLETLSRDVYKTKLNSSKTKQRDGNCKQYILNKIITIFVSYAKERKTFGPGSHRSTKLSFLAFHIWEAGFAGERGGVGSCKQHLKP